MSNYFTADVTVALNTATKLVDSATVDRNVYIREISISTPGSLGFDSSSMIWPVTVVSPFFLPAGEGLWVNYPSPGGSAVVKLLVTGVPEGKITFTCS